jgi:hypothetical protein
VRRSPGSHPTLLPGWRARPGTRCLVADSEAGAALPQAFPLCSPTPNRPLNEGNSVAHVPPKRRLGASDLFGKLIAALQQAFRAVIALRDLVVWRERRRTTVVWRGAAVLRRIAKLVLGPWTLMPM